MIDRQPHVVGIGPNKPCDWCGRSDYCLDPFLCFMSWQKEKEMSCQDCKEAQNQGMVAPYRFGIANIDVLGCRKHVKEVFDILNVHQGQPSGGVDTKYGDLHIAGIPPKEPVFVLRAQDAHAIYVIEEYQRLAGSHDKNMADSLDLTLARFKSWPTKKLPD